MNPNDLDSARRLVREKRMDDAERAYLRLLETQPDSVEALSFLAGCALGRGQSDHGIALLQRALTAQPGDVQVLTSLGIALEHAGRRQEAQAVLRKALAAEPGHFVARLHLAAALEQCGEELEALTATVLAIRQAQAEGHWLSDASTAPWLRDRVRHAMRYAEAGRRRHFDAALAPLRQRHGREALQRVEHALALSLDPGRSQPTDSRQRPKFFYFPGLPSPAFLRREDIPWIPELESMTGPIRGEALEALSDGGAVEPFLRFKAPDQVKDFLKGGEQAPEWNAFFFYRHGTRYDRNCQRCPRTTAVLDGLPLAHVREHAPEICYSVLTPGTHILPHHGVTNTRIVVHLPLVVQGDCALRVDRQVHAWQEGRCVAFDDTYEHEAWNRGTGNRIVLLMDAWNPFLTEAERDALATLIPAIGDFNRKTELATGDQTS